ncbi:hypothetical protein E2562_009107 [Oryza meyeriana var. granulata]|uniref:Uncharacterized protein n=1 Tax=Oryza meyeriana var. granulata TaxID=110450 RepID=A0A6G1D130_9ORYZ|nr:hypothetical protein E2562_009107 [Oryza meyeriana var. granulata]
MFIAENARVLEKMVIKLKVGRYSETDVLAAKLMDVLSAKWANAGGKMEIFTPCSLYSFKPRSRNNLYSMEVISLEALE